MPDRFGNYTPPLSDGLPAHGKAILSEVYSSCRRNNPTYPKARCAKIAWGAVHNAGFKKLPGGKWGSYGI